MMQKLKLIQILVFACVVVIFLNQLIGNAHAVTPSQVLVLYNADWKADDPGQDSKEIADHYISMHTDPDTGGKPYV